ncbi:MAG: hypothetical protein IKB05_01480 [Alphaproteobacteria bacterium]|nr:hypothetical protein [Alphaproteobacteria bacterium]
MKTYLFVFMAGVTAIFFSYVAGVRLGRQQCRADVAQQSGYVQSETIKIIGDVNAETFNRGVDDIRHVLHEKYTIAE